MMRLLLAALFVGAVVAFPRQPKAPACGYSSCPKADPNKLNIHMVPHTHDDVGWLKTVDQYYYGSRSNIQNAGVQYILDSVIDALSKNPTRKFIYVETAFFWKWWVEQTPEQQALVKNLVNNGQLEFIGGAWSMNDEATTLYQTTIDQFTWGLRRLNDTFGSCGIPRIGWQIDPFGHSREQASLMAQYNFDALFFARLDYQDKSNRLKTKTMETIWETDPSLGSKTDMFTGAFYDFYMQPPGFCFDVECNDEPIIDNPDLPDYNVPARVEEFVKLCKEQQSKFLTNNIMLTMGGDFQYQNAGIYFKNMDKLIKAVNQLHPEVNAFYSTPSCYVKSKNEANIVWPKKSYDDFFPYASNKNTYWTGYFTSRPTLKRYERLANNILQAGKQLSAIANVDDAGLVEHKETQGILQHHDAVAGTEKQHVAEDYARLLYIAVEGTEGVISNALNTLMRKDASSPQLKFDSCTLRNISTCSVTENSSAFLITVYNPLSRVVTSYARVPVGPGNYQVLDPTGKVVASQLAKIPEHLERVPGRTGKATQDLIFRAANLPALGYRTYYISETKEESAKVQNSRVWVPKDGEEVEVGNENLSLVFDGKTKLLQKIISNKEIYDTVQSHEYYIGFNGDNGDESRRSSGAYIFRPTTKDSIAMSDGSNITIVDGPVVSEVHQVFSNWSSQVIRHYIEDPDIVEFNWLVGPIPIDDGQGKEVVTKYRTNLKTNGLITTDSSGRNDIQRKRDFRPSWTMEVNEPVAGNYYPIVLDTWIDNGTDRLALITDRAQGAASIKDGELEVMLHRRLLHDDAFGVGEAINEQAYGAGLVARGYHYVLVGPSNGVASTKNIRLLEQQKYMDSLLFMTDVTGKTFADVQKTTNLEFSGLSATLPEGVQILTLEPWKDNTFILRLENIFTTEQAPTPVTVDVSTIFTKFRIVDGRETTLAANIWLDEAAARLQWKKSGSVEMTPGVEQPEPFALTTVTLAPKQIRTEIPNMVMDQDPMDSLPAPDMVGREFVRQYYTLLNEAPEHAHRFYNANSYFVHGSMTKPAIGQIEIHRKIQQLNFRDCHAKISQVDSQVTLGNGVVVQVSGELSNDGEPMRRFSQTFVLGTQSPKKYYVHNDIFRYQDMLQSDEEGDVSTDKDDSNTELQESSPHDYYQPTVETAPTSVTQQQQQQQASVTTPPQVAAVPHVNVNGNAAGMHHLDDRDPRGAPVPPEQSGGKSAAENATLPVVMNGGPLLAEDLNRMIPAERSMPEPAVDNIGHTNAGLIMPDEPVQKTEPVVLKEDYDDENLQEHISDGSEQKTTFANLLKNGRTDRNPSRQFRGSPGMHYVSHGPPPAASMPPPADDDWTSANNSSPAATAPQPPRGPPSNSGGERERRNYSDSQQLFLGNLPPEATEKELRSIFSTYGRVIDLKVHTNTKSMGNTRNYAFVTFEEVSAVNKCFDSKPIYYDQDQHVELVIEYKNQYRGSGRGSQDGRSGSGGWSMSRGQSGRGRGTPRGAPRGSFPPRGTSVSSRPFSSSRR